MDGLDALLQRIARYPTEEKVCRIQRFFAQFEAWNWYVHEALRLDNRYLLSVSVSKLVLFGGRLILAHNQQLYPFHKWFLRVLDAVLDKPTDLVTRIQQICQTPDEGNVRAFYECIRNFRQWEVAETSWPNQFMVDSELNWLNGTTPVDDL
jgi:hypothetical protein